MTKDDVLAGLKRSPVAFPVGGLTLCLKPWSAARRAEFAAWRRDNPTDEYLAAKMFALSVCDPAGTLLFADADVASLADTEGAGAVLERVSDRVIDLNGLGGDDAKN